MWKRIDLRGAFALPLLLALGADSFAATPVAPARPLDDPAALKAAFVARIGRPVQVLDFRLGEHYAQALVQGADGEFDVFEAVPGQPMPDGRPKKAGEVDCRKSIAFAGLDLALGARLLAESRSIAAANGYAKPENVELGSGILCEDFGWRALLTTEANSSTLLVLTWAPDGSAPNARLLKDDHWVRLDALTLLAGGAKPPAAPPKAQTRTIAGDGRKRDFLGGIEADLARIEAETGAPLALHAISIDSRQLSVDLAQPRGKKRRATWLVNDDGSLRLWREDDSLGAYCGKPFAAADFPLAQLRAMIAEAPALIPPMARGRVKDVAIRRSGFCGTPHAYIQIEDERGYGNVEYDQNGRVVRAEIQ